MVIKKTGRGWSGTPAFPVRLPLMHKVATLELYFYRMKVRVLLILG
jgi:hypothetical protein